MFNSLKQKFESKIENIGHQQPSVNYNNYPGQGQSTEQYQQKHEQQYLSSNIKEYAPRVRNASNKEIVHTRLLILEGTAGPNGPCDASIIVYHHINSFPALRYQVTDGYFKALVHLNPGINELRLAYEDSSGKEVADSKFTVNYVPLLQNPPVHFALIVAKDSKLEFDSPDYKKRAEGGNGLDLAIKKVRLAAYMMSAYTNEQMKRAGYGNRTFRIHEEFDKDTLSNRDKNKRSTAMIHIIRSDKTMAEIRDPNIAQQNHQGTDRGALYGIALDAIKKHGGILADKGDTTMVAALFLDAHYDPKQKLITGHAALGGGAGYIKLGIFGSHALWSFPSCLEDVTPAFLDDTRFDTNQVAKDCDGEGTAWEVLNVGFGAWLHEIGHLLGCPHQPYGIMMRDWFMNRSFLSREAYCGANKSPGKRPIQPQDESVWHPDDLIRFRYHPAFRSPFENAVDRSRILFFPLENGVSVKSLTGVYMIEVHCGDGWPNVIRYDTPQHELFLFEDDLLQCVKPERRNDTSKPLNLWVLAVGEIQEEVKDFRVLAHSSQIHDTFDRNRGVLTGLRSYKVGTEQGGEQTVTIPPTLRGIRVRCGNAVDAIEFITESGETRVFGGNGGGMHEFMFQPGEKLVGFFVRAGAWLDCVQIITNYRRSELFGNVNAGTGADFVPPAGYELVGIKGNVKGWITSFSILYAAD